MDGPAARVEDGEGGLSHGQREVLRPSFPAGKPATAIFHEVARAAA
jgi:hypothetical protein